MGFFLEGLKRVILVIGFPAAAVLLFILAPASSPSLAGPLTPEWKPVGEPLKKTRSLYVDVDASLHVLDPSLSSDETVLYSAWVETDSHGVPLLLFGKWNGKQWTRDPLALNFDRDRKASDLSIGSSGKSLTVAWIEEKRGSPPRLYAKTLQNGKWISGKKPLNHNPSLQAANPVIAASGGGPPFLAWSERDPHRVFQLHVKQLDGSGWYSVGQESLNLNPSRDAVEADMALLGDQPFIAWTEPSERGIYQVLVKQWNGSSWELLGDPLNILKDRHAVNPQIEIFNHSPYVSWMEITEAGLFNPRIKRWSGKEWISVGSGLHRSSSGHALGPVMKAGPGSLYLAWNELDENGRHQILLKRWDGKNWTDLPSPSPANGRPVAGSPSLELHENDLYLAWKELNADGFFEMRVSRLKTK